MWRNNIIGVYLLKNAKNIRFSRFDLFFLLYILSSIVLIFCKTMSISSAPSIDFYVSVIDNYGDMGFAVNLALSLHDKYPHLYIRFFSDDHGLFQKFFPGNTPEWIEYVSLDVIGGLNPPIPSSLIFSFFDYRVPKEYLFRFPHPKTIISFSYFLLHTGLESLHKTTYLLESGYDTVIHFVPSLASGGWGIIMNPEIENQQAELEKYSRVDSRKSFLGKILDIENRSLIYEKKWISVFVYKETLKWILSLIEKDTSGTIFWICGNSCAHMESVNIRALPFLSLEDYGVFQSLCDANIVRGENSLCQSLISWKPTLWDIYKESNGAHVEKIEDYLLFLGKQFPDTDWWEYSSIMRGFNEVGDMESAFCDFISGYSAYDDGFWRLSEYITRECDLVEKLEQILG